MNYSIEQKENFNIFTPQNNLFSCTEKNFLHAINECKQNKLGVVLDLGSITNESSISPKNLHEIHSSFYENDLSFVLCNAHASIIKKLEEDDLLELLNYTPTLIEAIDFVSMENLERELLNGEDF